MSDKIMRYLKLQASIWGTCLRALLLTFPFIISIAEALALFICSTHSIWCVALSGAVFSAALINFSKISCACLSTSCRCSNSFHVIKSVLYWHGFFVFRYCFLNLPNCPIAYSHCGISKSGKK